jgi:hypothetical protein
MERSTKKTCGGYPKKFKEPLQLVSQQVDNEEVENSAPKKKRRGSYTNWFIPILWPPILAAIRCKRI